MNQDRPALGTTYMLTSCIGFCAMTVLVKLADAAGLHAFAIVFYRFAVSILLLLAVAAVGRARLRFVNLRILFLRGFVGGTGVLFFYLAITKLGIAKGTVLAYSYPIFTAVFSASLLKERIGPAKALLIAIAFAGLCLLAYWKAAGAASPWELGRFELLGVFGAICGGLAVVYIKQLHDTDTSYAIFFAQSAVGAVIAFVPAAGVGMAIEPRIVWLLVGLGIATSAGQLLMTEGFKYIGATTGSLLGMLVPVANLFVGVLLFNEQLSLPAISGSVMVILSCTLVVFWDQRNHKRIPAA